MNELYKFYKNNIVTDRYKYIFWEREDIKKLSPEEFKIYLNKLNKDKEYYSLIQRFTERGLITATVYFFELRDILYILKTANYWKSMPISKLEVWKYVINSLNESNRE